MKTLKILLIALMIVSCSAEETDDCNCIKEVYDIEQNVVWSNGLPTMQIEHVFLYDEPVGCIDEVSNQEMTGNQYFNIVCE